MFAFFNQNGWRRGVGIAVSLVAGGALLAGCSSSVEPGFVAKDWSAKMRELQINPIFPPREDVQVGDIYIPATQADEALEVLTAEGYLPISLWLGTLDLREELSNFYSFRNSYPKTALVKSGEDNVSNYTPQPVLGSEGPNGNGDVSCRPEGNSRDLTCQSAAQNADIYLTGNRARMRLVGFPEFFSVSVTSGQLDALIPSELITATLGVGFEEVEQATIKVPAAESVGLPMTAVYDKVVGDGNEIVLDLLTSDAATRRGRSGEALCSELDLELVLSQGPVSPDGQFRLVVVTEVYYARQLDVSVSFANSAGLQIDFDPTTAGIQSTSSGGGSGQGQGAADGATQTGGTGEQAGGDDALPSADEISQRAVTLSTANRAHAGAGIELVGGGAGRVALRRTFERPMAIGYRAWALNVEPSKTANGALVCRAASGGGAQGGAVLGTDPADTD